MKNTSFSQSFLFALKGISRGISDERNIKIQMVIGLGILTISLLLEISRIDFIIILSVSFLVIILELINTCLEQLIDFITLEPHKQLGTIKDIMAGAVLLSVILAVIVGFIILSPLLIGLFREVLP
ncbi:MAG: diacylglycerol kinase family protein [Nanoarchaeota archaeon]|nr:diacylglycerol kinase family protein [Nanoarchaeota archaeon]